MSDDMLPTAEQDMIEITVQVVSAYLSKNSLPAAELPALIVKVHAALNSLSAAAEPQVAPETQKPSPAQVRRSVTSEALISFIDGRPYKTLKRHLTRHGLDPQGYRDRYGLPRDYPMVAAGYAARRSELARSFGLGRGVAARKLEASEAVAPKRRGRPRRAREAA